MAVAVLTQEAASEALSALRRMLETDGYQLEVSGAPIEVRIVATEAACAECLVPRSVLEPMIADALGVGRPDGLEGDYSVHYPATHVDA